MPRAAKPAKPRHDPLHVELEADDSLRRFGRVSKSARPKRTEDGEEGMDVSSRLLYISYVEVKADIPAIGGCTNE
jgi:hypothetical protein